MRWKLLLSLLASCAFGFLVAMLTFHSNQSAKPSAEEGSRTRASEVVTDTALRADLAFPMESKSVVTEREPPAAAPAKETLHPFFADVTKKARAEARQSLIDKLLQAGFSPQRIEWLNKRSAELRQQVAEGLKERSFSNAKAWYYTLDPDIDLVQETSEEEYDRYRQALGRPLGVPIDPVVPNSIQDQAGLRTGDQVVMYSGKRVYNDGMLRVAMGKPGSREQVSVTVLRNGQRVQLFVPSDSIVGSTSGAVGASISASKAAVILKEPSSD
jgi:hypothetical protein